MRRRLELGNGTKRKLRRREKRCGGRDGGVGKEAVTLNHHMSNVSILGDAVGDEKAVF